MNILHIEDYDIGKGKDYAKILSGLLPHHGVIYKNIESYDSLLELDPNKFDVIILDGQFPEAKGCKPDISSFRKSIELFRNKGFDFSKLIVWSNSTRVHALCNELRIRYFSKKIMQTKDYIEKEVNPKVMAKQADENTIKELIMSSLS